MRVPLVICDFCGAECTGGAYLQTRGFSGIKRAICISSFGKSNPLDLCIDCQDKTQKLISLEGCV